MWAIASNVAQHVYTGLLKCKLPVAPDASCGVTEPSICPEGSWVILARLLPFNVDIHLFWNGDSYSVTLYIRNMQFSFLFL